MDQKLRERITPMLKSDDKEMNRLGQALFWESDPTYQDYMKIADEAVADYITIPIFYRLKNTGKAYIVSREGYIYKYAGLIHNLNNEEL